MIDYSRKEACLGEFQEKSCGCYFTFEVNKENFWVCPRQFPHLIHMSDGTVRKAKVMKTVAKVVVDEDKYGNPVVETWKIKKVIIYPR